MSQIREALTPSQRNWEFGDCRASLAAASSGATSNEHIHRARQRKRRVSLSLLVACCTPWSKGDACTTGRWANLYGKSEVAGHWCATGPFWVKPDNPVPSSANGLKWYGLKWPEGRLRGLIDTFGGRSRAWRHWWSARTVRDRVVSANKTGTLATPFNTLDFSGWCVGGSLWVHSSNSVLFSLMVFFRCSAECIIWYWRT